MRKAIQLLNQLKVVKINEVNNGAMDNVYTQLNDDCISHLQHLGFNTDYVIDNEYEDSGVYVDLSPAAMALWAKWDRGSNSFKLIIDLIDNK
jgi:hypothetical protein